MNIRELRRFGSFHYVTFFFLFTQAIILSSLAFNTATQVLLLWSCNNFCFFLAFACYRRDMQMLMGVSYLGLVAQMLWAADFLLQFVGINFSSISDYIFTEGFTYANDVSIGLHLIVPLLILIFSLTTKPTTRSLLYAGGYSAALYVATLLMSTSYEDVNCVYNGCNIGINFSYRIFEWPLFAAVAIGASYIIHQFLYMGWRWVWKQG